MTNLKKYLLLAIGAVALQLLAPVATAAEPWEVTLTPYAWLQSIDAELKLDRGNGMHDNYNGNMSFDDLVQDLNIGGSLLTEINRGKWVNMIQVDYFSLSFDDLKRKRNDVETKTDLDTDATFLSAGTGYRFQTGERSTLDLLVGVRYLDVQNDLKLRNGENIDTGDKLTDGIVMLRPRVAFLENWTFSPTLSVGAGDSDLVYELSPMFYYDWKGTEIRFGYRNVTYEFKNDGRNGDNELDITFGGLMIGVGFTFD